MGGIIAWLCRSAKLSSGRARGYACRLRKGCTGVRGSGRGRGLAGLVVSSARRGAPIAGPVLCGCARCEVNPVAARPSRDPVLPRPALCGCAHRESSPAAVSRFCGLRSLRFSCFRACRISANATGPCCASFFAIARPRYSSNSAMTSAFDVVPNLAYR